MHSLRRDRNIILFVLLLLILGGAFVSLNIFSYFDPLNMCRIRIEEKTLQGNRSTIKLAIKLLKIRNKDDYRIVCKYVDTISEKRCFNADGHIDEHAWQVVHDGCFVRGSKYVYILPEQENSPQVVETRADLILQLAKQSQAFWLAN